MVIEQNTIAAMPPPSGEIQALKHLTPAEIKEAEQMARALDVRDSLAITSFGVKPQ